MMRGFLLFMAFFVYVSHFLSWWRVLIPIISIPILPSYFMGRFIASTSLLWKYAVGFPLTIQIPFLNGIGSNLIIALISLIAALFAVVFYLKVYLPMMQKRKEAEIRNTIKHVAQQEGVEEYSPIIGSPLWNLFALHRSYVKSKRKDDPADALEQLVDEVFPEKFEKDEEQLLIGFCQLLANVDHTLFLARLTSLVLDAIESNSFSLDHVNHDFMVQCWNLSRIIEKEKWNLQINRNDYDKLGNIIQQLENLVYLHDVLIPFICRIIEGLKEQPGNHVSSISLLSEITTIFQGLSYEYKQKFMYELQGVGNQPIIDSIMRTVSFVSFVLEEDPETWESIFSDFIELGYKHKSIPVSLENLDEVSFEKRYEMVEFLINMHRLDDTAKGEIISSLLEIKEGEYESFYEYDIAPDIFEYCRKKGITSFPCIAFNEQTVLEIFYLYQKRKIPSDNLLSFIDNMHDETVSKITSNTAAHSILRYTIGNIISENLGFENYEIGPLLKLYGPPFDSIIDIVGVNINRRILDQGNNRDFQEFLLSLQSVLLDAGTPKKKVNQIGKWIKLWSTVNEQTRDATDQYDYTSRLLDVLTAADVDVPPLYIAQEQLSLIDSDFEGCVRVIHNLEASSPEELERKYTRRVENARKRLKAVKNSYYKLRMVANNQTLELTEETRNSMRKIANEILGVTIKARRKDWKDRLDNFPLDFPAVIDPGALLKSAINQAQFIYFPATFHKFALPALRVLNEFLMEPEKLPYAGNKAHGIIISPDYWLFSTGIGMTLAPNIAFSEETYSNFFVPEFLRTAALAFKRGAPWIKKLLTKRLPIPVEPDLSSILVNVFKRLTEHDFFQGVITREHIIQALEYGHWDKALADKIIEEQEFCVYCSYALPENAKVCPNCERAVEDFDLASMAGEEMEINLDGVELGTDSDLGLTLPEGEKEPIEPTDDLSNILEEEDA
ncbi:MAG: hypothetical protein KGY80_06940 [Candidatus Thorarchaeota archaeon]|nr:hypothetical protein [Candidatus Thorarchaeota archaeon]